MIVNQLETFTRGIPFLDVVTAASVGNGIEVITDNDQKKLISLYEHKKDSLEVVKFVPASGAATRMFQSLHRFLESYDPNKETLNEFLRSESDSELTLFFKSLKDFAFEKKVRKKIRKNYPEYKHCTKGLRFLYFVKTMMEKEGLNFSELPKGLIPFHKYSKYATTAFEEQLFESAYYSSVKDEVFVHFTFAEDHVEFFKQEFQAIRNRISKKTKTKFNISYSFQKKETDTIAVTLENKLFRDERGDLVFRPSGHGALLSNLQDVDADIIFIKNIDNVAAEEYVEANAYYKKLLAGKLIWLQNKMFNYIHKLKEGLVSEELLKEMRSFLWNELNIKEIPDSRVEILTILNKPIRICGVVKNTGAPGGGPYWVKDKNGIISLQIVETSQIDLTVERQQVIVNEATHFNPVDIVCGIRDYQGNKFDLFKYSDHDAGLISLKSQNGNTLKALELPGLWNGAMAKWNTALVEVPLHTFNPVKTVTDLLYKEHRPNA